MSTSSTDPSKDWRHRAKCKDIVDPDEFFPSENDRAQGRRVIRKYCDKCPVVVACLNYALCVTEVTGIWGGFTPIDIRKIKRGMSPEALKQTRLDAMVYELRR